MRKLHVISCPKGKEEEITITSYEMLELKYSLETSLENVFRVSYVELFLCFFIKKFSQDLYYHQKTFSRTREKNTS